MEIAQCRGLKNNNSNHHKVILSLMKKPLSDSLTNEKAEKGKSLKPEKPKKLRFFRLAFHRHYKAQRPFQFLNVVLYLCR
jgi:hypothetical protein